MMEAGRAPPECSLADASPALCAAGAYNSETSHSLSMISVQSMPYVRLFWITATLTTCVGFQNDLHISLKGFPCGSAGKEAACSTGDLGSIPGLERSLEKGKATHSYVLA